MLYIYVAMVFTLEFVECWLKMYQDYLKIDEADAFECNKACVLFNEN